MQHCGKGDVIQCESSNDTNTDIYELLKDLQVWTRSQWNIWNIFWSAEIKQWIQCWACTIREKKDTFNSQNMCLNAQKDTCLVWRIIKTLQRSREPVHTIIISYRRAGYEIFIQKNKVRVNGLHWYNHTDTYQIFIHVMLSSILIDLQGLYPVVQSLESTCGCIDTQNLDK